MADAQGEATGGYLRGALRKGAWAGESARPSSRPRRHGRFTLPFTRFADAAPVASPGAGGPRHRGTAACNERGYRRASATCRRNRPPYFDRICSRIYGLEAEHAAFVKERIDGVAAEIGISTAKSAKCTPNVIVVFTLDADPLTAAFIKRYPEMIGEIQRGAVNARTKAPFLTPHPVRWFGHDMTRRDPLSVASRIHANSSQVINATYVIVDLNRLAGVNWGQLADFITFVSLSRPEFDRIYRDPGTILSLFTARDAGAPLPEGLTRLDRSFLSNLYATASNRDADVQQMDIRRRVKADLRHDDAER